MYAGRHRSLNRNPCTARPEAKGKRSFSAAEGAPQSLICFPLRQILVFFHVFSAILFVFMGAIGIIMATIYKNVQTAEGFMRLPSERILRIFLVVFVLTVLGGLFSAWMAQNSFTSSPIPEQNLIRFRNYKSMMIFTGNLGFFLMLIHANFYSFSQKKVMWIPYALACGAFVLLCMKDSLFLEPYLDLYRSKVLHEAVDASGEISRMWTKIVMGVSITLTNALAVAWGIRK